MSAAGAERLAGQYGVSAGVNATGVLAWSAKRKMARLYHADLAELAWARYDKVTIQASVPGADGQQLGAGAEEQLDNRPDPRAREAYAFFKHGATETAGGCVLSCLINLITWISNFKQEIKSNQHWAL